MPVPEGTTTKDPTTNDHFHHYRAPIRAWGVTLKKLTGLRRPFSYQAPSKKTWCLAVLVVKNLVAASVELNNAIDDFAAVPIVNCQLTIGVVDKVAR
jgi:hypothetical protein